MTSLTTTPRLIVFECDNTLWSTEMLRLTEEPKWSKKSNSMKAGKERVKLFEGGQLALREIHTAGRFANTTVAVASTTTEPEYAKACLDNLEICDGVKMSAIVKHTQMYPGSKTAHLNKLKEVTGCPFDKMLFFDDCSWGDNCADVELGCPGVITLRTPDGLTEALWREGLAKFEKVVLRTIGRRLNTTLKNSYAAATAGNGQEVYDAAVAHLRETHESEG